MILLGLFARSPSSLRWLAFAGLALSAFALTWSLVRENAPLGLLGLDRFSAGVRLWLASAAAVGVLLAVAYRAYTGQSTLPNAFFSFALLSASIGCVEEIVYRGHVQGQLKGFGTLGAVLCASVLHSAYKASVFLLDPVSVDVSLLAVITFGGGVLLGTLREASGSLLPAVVAHACFNMVVYADTASAPWWVW